ncbi:zinc finger protein 311-like [Armigeres subalbatus]|uniref:zinc finger protein 311-like n=1 Tax=Armigeres subalbatus TaxID=124917 RepID=UPI002ED3463B
MPSKCAVLSCPIYSPNKEIGLFRIPAVRVRASEDLRVQMLQRRARWGEVLHLSDPQMSHALVCGRHFVSGKPSAPEEIDSVDWVPTLHLDVDELVRRRSLYQPENTETESGVEVAGESSGARIETTAASCCVPGCENQQQQWLTDFPRDKELQQRWLTAILVGSGETVFVEEEVGGKAQVCNVHFAARAPEAIANGVDNEYREPTLFVRDNIIIQVTSCRLCMNFDTVDNMYNMKREISDGHTLQWLAKKYFAQFLSATEYAEEGFFCERCTVQVDMTHVFWREISDKSRKFKWLLRKMASERVEFSSKIDDSSQQTSFNSGFEFWSVPLQPDVVPSAEVLFIKEEPEDLDDGEMQVECDPKLYNTSSEGESDGPEKLKSTITKEQTKLSKPPSIHLVKPPPLKVQLNFKCNVCSSRHENKNTLIHHLMMDHQDHTALKCQECDISYKNIILFNKHLAMHDPVKRIKCSHCPLRFRKTSARAKHEAARHGTANTSNATATTPAVKDKTKKNQCSQCDKSFVYISELKRHEKFKHKGEAIARCEICDKAFASNRNLSRHLKLHREDAKADNLTTRNRKAGVIACNLCDMVFSETRDMAEHLKETHPDAKFKIHACQQCDQIFLSQPSLANHSNIHSDVFGCDLCGKRHYSKMMLLRHRNKKHGIELDDDQYETCRICARRFIKGWDFIRHEQSHEKEKFSCETCGKTYKTSVQLTKHERVHTEEKPYDCPACGMMFGSPASVTRHKKTCPKIVLDQQD